MKPDSNKIVEYFNNLSDQARYTVLVVVVLVIILLDVFFLSVPQVASIADLNTKIAKLSRDTQQVLTDRTGTNLLRKNLEEQRLQLNSLSTRVRSIQEVPAILSTISSIANEYGVKIDQLVPEKSQQESLTATANGKYYALPIVIKARCGYHMFGRFLNKLEYEDMYFMMKDFIIQNDDNDTNTHSFALTITMILVDQTGPQVKNL